MDEEVTPEKIDWQAVFRAVSLPLLYWAIAVGLVSWLNTPALGCLMPGGWLMGVSTGRRVAQFTHSQEPKARNREAAIAGILLGLALSAVFILWSMGPLGGLAAWNVEGDRSGYFLVMTLGLIGNLAVPAMLSVSTLNARIPRRP